MIRSRRIVLAAALLLSETSLATAQNALPNSGYPGVAGGANGNPFRAGINETTSVPSVPYYGPIYDYYPVPYYAPSTTDRLTTIRVTMRNRRAGASRSLSM